MSNPNYIIRVFDTQEIGLEGEVIEIYRDLPFSDYNAAAEYWNEIGGNGNDMLMLRWDYDRFVMLFINIKTTNYG